MSSWRELSFVSSSTLYILISVTAVTFTAFTVALPVVGAPPEVEEIL